ncbi:MAG: hypothetical protein AB7I38_10825 [Dehalococcoidia bacterium]
MNHGDEQQQMKVAGGAGIATGGFLGWSMGMMSGSMVGFVVGLWTGLMIRKGSKQS